MTHEEAMQQGTEAITLRTNQMADGMLRYLIGENLTPLEVNLILILALVKNVWAMRGGQATHEDVEADLQLVVALFRNYAGQVLEAENGKGTVIENPAGESKDRNNHARIQKRKTPLRLKTRP